MLMLTARPVAVSKKSISIPLNDWVAKAMINSVIDKENDIQAVYRIVFRSEFVMSGSCKRFD